MRLSYFNPTAGKEVFVFPVQFGDNAMLETRPHAVRHVAITDDAGCDHDRRIRVTCSGAFQFLAKHHAHAGLRNLIQSIHKQQDFSPGNSVEDNGTHNVRIFREECRVMQVLGQKLGEATALVGLTQFTTANKHGHPGCTGQCFGVGKLVECIASFVS